MVWIWTSSLLMTSMVVTSLSFPLPNGKYFIEQDTVTSSELDEIVQDFSSIESDFKIMDREGNDSYETSDIFEEANIRSSSSPDGSYEFSYDTSSHSRSEAGDSDINVDGKFAFIADDNKEREINYEAGTDTGFIARGAHIPVGPEVPGALSGQPTGDFDHVESVNFVDPLAKSDTDSSYNFNFNSRSYSRSENADEDGNVSGTYTVVDDDGLSITYRFRAGKGIGYEVEEVSLTQGPKPVKPTPYSGDLAFDDEHTFDVPGTPNFPTPGQSNYVYQNANPSPVNGGTSTTNENKENVGVPLLVASNIVPTIFRPIASSTRFQPYNSQYFYS